MWVCGEGGVGVCEIDLIILIYGKDVALLWYYIFQGMSYCFEIQEPPPQGDFGGKS